MANGLYTRLCVPGVYRATEKSKENVGNHKVEGLLSGPHCLPALVHTASLLGSQYSGLDGSNVENSFISFWIMNFRVLFFFKVIWGLKTKILVLSGNVTGNNNSHLVRKQPEELFSFSSFFTNISTITINSLAFVYVCLFLFFNMASLTVHTLHTQNVVKLYCESKFLGQSKVNIGRILDFLPSLHKVGISPPEFFMAFFFFF